MGTEPADGRGMPAAYRAPDVGAPGAGAGRAAPGLRTGADGAEGEGGGEHDHADGGCRMCAEDAAAVAAGEALLAERERSLGRDHPDTLAARHDLAVTYRQTGWLGVDPVAMLEGVRADRERVLGSDHPGSLATRLELVRLRDSREHPGALEELAALVADHDRVLGPEHAETIAVRKDLAFAYCRRPRRDHRSAVPLLEAALGDALRGPGPDDPETLQTRNDLAIVYEAAGERERAIALWRVAVREWERVLGRADREPAAARGALARLLWEAGDQDEAVSLQAESVAGFERARDAFAVAVSRGELAGMRLARGEAATAVELYRGALDLAEGHGCPKEVVRAIRTKLIAAERAAGAGAGWGEG